MNIFIGYDLIAISVLLFIWGCQNLNGHEEWKAFIGTIGGCFLFIFSLILCAESESKKLEPYSCPVRTITYNSQTSEVSITTTEKLKIDNLKTKNLKTVEKFLGKKFERGKSQIIDNNDDKLVVDFYLFENYFGMTRSYDFYNKANVRIEKVEKE